jgi:hypothetical protein
VKTDGYGNAFASAAKLLLQQKTNLSMVAKKNACHALGKNWGLSTAAKAQNFTQYGEECTLDAIDQALRHLFTMEQEALRYAKDGQIFHSLGATWAIRQMGLS